MKIFISWSGLRSQAIAAILKDWLQRVIQAVEPFYTPDMEKGSKWSNEIDAALEGTRFGIVCLTPDNLQSTWIHFETGALSKTKDAVIWTFLHGVLKKDVPQPLGKFQHTADDKEDVFKLLQSINTRLQEVSGNALKESLLQEIFEESWPKLQSKLREAESIDAGPVKKTRDNEDILNEILETVREQQRQMLIFEERFNQITIPNPGSNKAFLDWLASVPAVPRPKSDSASEELLFNGVRYVFEDDASDPMKWAEEIMELKEFLDSRTSLQSYNVQEDVHETTLIVYFKDLSDSETLNRIDFYIGNNLQSHLTTRELIVYTPRRAPRSFSKS